MRSGCPPPGITSPLIFETLHYCGVSLCHCQAASAGTAAGAKQGLHRFEVLVVCIVEDWDGPPASHFNPFYVAGSNVWWRGGAVACQTQASGCLLIYWLQAQAEYWTFWVMPCCAQSQWLACVRMPMRGSKLSFGAGLTASLAWGCSLHRHIEFS